MYVAIRKLVMTTHCELQLAIQILIATTYMYIASIWLQNKFYKRLLLSFMHTNLYYKLNKESKQHTCIDEKIKVPHFI